MNTTAAARSAAARAERAPGGEPTFEAVLGILQGLVEEMERQIQQLAARVRGDVEGLARVIERTREELRELEPEELRQRHLAVANGELGAVARHLEEATNEILDACEKIERMVERIPEELRDGFTDQVTRIYEACSFHDISGQRIRKVVNSLEEIERRLQRLKEAYGMPRTVDPRESAGRRDDLCNGPALPGEGTSQDEVDALLGGTSCARG